jgi:hypothetical protein
MFVSRVLSTGLFLALLHGIWAEERAKELNRKYDDMALQEETVIWGREIRKLNLMSMTQAPTPPKDGQSKLSVS